MLAGIPMLLLPLHDEQRMACARVVEAGAGLTIPPETQSGRIVEAMKSILLDKRFKVSAATIRDRNAGLRPGESIDQIVSIAEGLSKSVERASLPRLSRK
jgi:hypothetical protein